MEREIQNLWRYLKKLTPLSSEEIMAQIAIILIICRRSGKIIQNINEWYYFFEIEFETVLLNDLKKINQEIYFKIPTPSILIKIVDLILYLQNIYSDCDIYEEFYKNYSNEKTSKMYITPNYLAQLMISLGEEANCKNILDCCCGTGNILYNSLEKQDIELNGIDLNKRALTILFFRSLFKNRRKINLEQQDCLSHGGYGSKYDLIFLDPPFGIKVEYDYLYTRVETGMIYKVLDFLSDKGKAVVVLPQSYLKLNLKEVKILKKKLIQENLLEKIVLLPSKVYPHTAIETLILVINKNKSSLSIKIDSLENETLNELKKGNLEIDKKILKNLKEITEDDFYNNNLKEKNIFETNLYLEKMKKLENLQAEIFQESRSLNEEIKNEISKGSNIKDGYILKLLNMEIQKIEILKKELQKFKMKIKEL